MSDRYGYYPPLNKPPDQTHHIPYDPHCHQRPPVVCPPSVGIPPVVDPPTIGGSGICPPTAPPPIIQICPPGPAIPSSDGVSWVPSSAGAPLPPYAVRGGRDRDGADIFVGRAFHDGDLIPAKVIPARQVAYVSYAGQEIPKHNFEVLCTTTYDYGRLNWRPCYGSSIPYGAIPGGHTASGETLYIGRVFHDGTQTVGKIHPSHGCCYIPYDGREISHQSFEILCHI